MILPMFSVRHLSSREALDVLAEAFFWAALRRGVRGEA